MKILAINFNDDNGGAAIAARRLTEALLKKNIDITLGVVEKKRNELYIHELPRVKHGIQKKIKNGIIRIASFAKDGFRKHFMSSNSINHSENKYSIVDINYLNCSSYDILHIHWVNNDMLSIEDIGKIKKPILWTMHDSWVFCGAEHHPNILENDNRYELGYFDNNKPKSTKGVDRCKNVWERKLNAWKNLNIYFASPSNFEKDLLKKSYLFSKSECRVIPNIIPKGFYKPRNKHAIRELLNIPNKKIIGFGGANNIDNNFDLKGWHILSKAFQNLQNKEDYFCIILGPSNLNLKEEFGINYMGLGKIESDILISMFFNAIDVFICPSLIENLPNVCLEALFCGTPVVAFDTGGIKDIIDHKQTGYLAEAFEDFDLLSGIYHCFDNLKEMKDRSLLKAANSFSEDQIVKNYIEYYTDIYKNENVIKKSQTNIS